MDSPTPPAMDTTAQHVLRQVIDYCDKKWTEADRPLPTELMQAMQAGKKAAYADVMHHARALLDDLA